MWGAQREGEEMLCLSEWFAALSLAAPDGGSWFESLV